MSNETITDEAVDDLTNVTESPTTSPSPQSPTSQSSNGSGGNKTKLVASEVQGDPPTTNGTGMAGEAGGGNDDDEVENSGGETGQENFETASVEQLAKQFDESAVSDFEGIEGFDPLSATEAAEAGEDDDDNLAEAGSVITGAESFESEEFGFLASVIPALVSTVGPALAKAVGKRISSRTRKRLNRRRKAAPKPTRTRRGPSRRNRILSLIANLLETAESMPDTESGAVVDEALAAEVAAVLEVVIGKDDRISITRTQQIPWRRICALRITFPSGKRYRGTGFFVGPRAVVTAGHCVYLHSQGGWARTVEVIPGANGSSRPYGTATSCQFRSVQGWVSNRKPGYDYGCVIVPSNSFGGRSLGQFGFGALPSSELLARPAVLAGYPGDKPFAEMWGMARRVKTVTSDRLIYDMDTAGGQSGAPLYIKRNGSRIVCGIHNYGSSGGNSATRVTPQVYQRLEGWRKI